MPHSILCRRWYLPPPSDALMAELLIVGGLLITGSGLSLLQLKDCRTLNLLPALLVPVIWFLLRGIF